MSSNKGNKKSTITFRPDPDVVTMLDRATIAPNGKRPWGTRSFMLNAALRDWLAKQGHARKRELTAAVKQGAA